MVDIQPDISSKNHPKKAGVLFFCSGVFVFSARDSNSWYWRQDKKTSSQSWLFPSQCLNPLSLLNIQIVAGLHFISVLSLLPTWCLYWPLGTTFVAPLRASWEFCAFWKNLGKAPLPVLQGALSSIGGPTFPVYICCQMSSLSSLCSVT